MMSAAFTALLRFAATSAESAFVFSYANALNTTTHVAYYSPGASQCGSITTNPCVVFTDANNHTTTYGYSGVEVQEVIVGTATWRIPATLLMPILTSMPTRWAISQFSGTIRRPTT